MMLVLQKRTTNAVSVEIVNDEGEPQTQRLLNRFKDKDIRWLCKVWGESVPVVTAKLNEIADNEDATPETLEFTPADGLIESIVKGVEVEKDREIDSDPIVIRVRNLDQLKAHSVTFSDVEPGIALRNCLTETWNHSPDPSLEFILEWNDLSKLACLDIDYHTVPLTDRPTIETLSTLVSSVRPQPYCWHPTHGKGAKLYYVATPGFTAKELASIAGITWITQDAQATFDIVKSSRHPCYNRRRDGSVSPCSTADDVRYVYGSGDLSSVKRLLVSDIEWSEVETYLEEQGWKVGDVLPHSECRIDPTIDHKSNVYVGDRGLFCHRCYARSMGSTPGFTSYASLIGCMDGRLTTMVKNFCHLEHASVVLENIYPTVPTKILEDVYRVMMKVVHTNDDPRIHMAMKSGTGFVRIKGQWVGTNGESSLAHGLPAFVSSLPATRNVKKGGEDAGKLVPDIPRTTAFLNDGDLSTYGYPDITFIRGCKIFGQFNSYPEGEVVKVVVRKEFGSTLPRYVPLNQRMDIEEAWQLLESEFPGINRNYVKLLIATKGASEGRLAQCPFLLISGPSGAGKSTTVHIAAGICGDKADEPIWNPNPERFRQGLMEGVRNSGFICVNEVFKYADDTRLSYTQALNPMLSLTEDSRSHVLYVGSVAFGRLPVFVLTDINIPPEVVADRQLARRFTFFRLDSENQWSETLVQRGIRPHQFRLISSTHRAAADAILSDVIDTYFTERMSLQEIATHLQTNVDYSEDVERKKVTLTDFFKLVCDAPDLAGVHRKRYNGLGWKQIDRMQDTPLLQAWNDLCDGQEPEKWNRSRRIDSDDWSKIVGVPFPILCEYRTYRNSTIYIRFRSAGSPKFPTWVNGVTQ